MHTLILGFDSFDPGIFERLAGEGRLPNLSRLAEGSQYAPLQVSDPPQTEVSWSSIATGLDPGGHGIFDFVHRDPATYTPFVSLLPTRRTRLGVQFEPPYRARTLFEETADAGYPAAALWWPAFFPARPELPVKTIPGLGTPDLLGRLGVGTLFTNESGLSIAGRKTAIKILQSAGKGIFSGILEGPLAKKGGQAAPVPLEIRLERLDERRARLSAGRLALELQLGQWSPVVELSFKVGTFVSVRAITRFLLTRLTPEVRLYALPVQIHPLAPTWRYATPPGFVKTVWKASGSYLSLGWPQDTTGLEEGWMSDEQFLELCASISESRERALMHLLEDFREGVTGIVFDDLDRVQHMFRRDRPEAVEDWYVRLDGLVGRVRSRLEGQSGGKARLIVISDHGFSDFHYKAHLNRWLNQQGYLAGRNGGSAGSLEQVDWSRSQAYAVGLNSLYVNQAGREGQGSVPASEAGQVVEKLRQELLEWRGPDGRPVVQRALRNDEAFSGPLASFGPDLLVGYTPGYRASSETGLGQWKAEDVEENHDHWGADHCIDSQSVPGVLFCNQGLGGISKPSFRDIPLLATGRQIQHKDAPPPPPGTAGGESKEAIEERLKSLGYL